MILYTSNKPFEKIMFHELLFSIFILVFGAIYEHFSFGVYSWYMVYAFAFPLLLCVLPLAVIAHSGRELPVKPEGIKLYRFGTATLTIGSIVTGIVEIYGTTNSLTRFYWITGALLIIIGAMKAFVPVRKESTV